MGLNYLAIGGLGPFCPWKRTLAISCWLGNAEVNVIHVTLEHDTKLLECYQALVTVSHQTKTRCHNIWLACWWPNGSAPQTAEHE